MVVPKTMQFLIQFIRYKTQIGKIQLCLKLFNGILALRQNRFLQGVGMLGEVGKAPWVWKDLCLWHPVARERWYFNIHTPSHSLLCFS